MAGIGDVGILFKIKADSDQAEREFKKFKKELDDIDARGKDPLQRLASQAGLTASQFSGLQTAVLGATAIIGAVGVAAIGAVTAIARLTVATAEYGSQIYDATIKTGLNAQSMSALKLAADTGGSSLESITGSVAKLNVLVGQAANDNEKAAKTLRDWGITATDTNEAFEQAVSVIGSMTDQGQKNAAAMALFKDRSGQVLGVIDQMNGDFKAFIATAEKLGLTLTEQDIKAADDFGDTLDILSKQAKAAGQQFALELMPNVTHAMQTISGEMENNQSVARSWGRAVGDIVRGLEVAILDLRLAFQSQFAGINAILGTNVTAMIDWANVVLGIVSPALAILRQVGQANPLGAGQMGGSFNPSAAIPNISRGGGGGGGGGRGGGGGGGKSAQDILNDKLDKGSEILADWDALREEVHQKELKRIEEERKADLKKLEAAIALEVDLDKLLDEFHEREKKRLQEINDLRQKAKLESDKKKAAEMSKKKFGQQVNSGSTASSWDSLTDGFIKLWDRGVIGGTALTAATAGIEALRGAFDGLGQAIGQVVQAWVLYGSAGASVRQVTAQILASIAQQAAVKAIFELAEGFAALAMAFFGIPNAGPSASAHFTAAAIYGSIAGVAAVAGRGVAGDSFNQTAGSAGSGGGGAGNGTSQQNNFTTRFNGFGNAMGEQVARQTQVLAALEETNNRLARRIDGMSPEQVVVLGANGASRAIVGALHSEYSDNPASVDGTMRNLGFAR